MKKIISVLLAIAVVLSSAAITSFGATATDEQIMSLLKSLDIMSGDENGNFNLEKRVTRAEFAKMAVASSVYRADVATVSRISPFSDVPYTYWGAPYIKAAAKGELIKGYPDSTFRPQENVLFEEGVTIALSVLGYQNSDFAATWPDGQLNTAKNLKLTEGLNNTARGSNMSRHDVMHLLYNVLNTNVKGTKATALSTYFGYNLTNSGDISNIIMDNSDIQGPITATSSNEIKLLGVVSENAKYYKDDKTATENDVIAGDVVYYSTKMDTVWIYSDKILGVYEKAVPAKDNLTSAVISGVSYEVESTTAFTKLSQGGSFEYGDTVLILLGKNGGIADVITPNAKYEVAYGYVSKTGTKQYEYSTGETYTSYYVSLISASGESFDYKTNKDYSSYISSVCAVTIENENAVLKRANRSLLGLVSKDKMTVGNKKLSGSIKIMDVMNTENTKNPAYTITYVDRLDGYEFDAGDVIFYTENAKGEIDTIFLNDITGDGYLYGVISDITFGKSQSGKNYISAFSVLSGDKTLTCQGNFKIDLSVGDAVKVIANNNKIESVKELIEIEEKVTEVNYGTITTVKKSYPLFENVVVYEKYKSGNGYAYRALKFSDITGESQTKLSAYKSNSALDRVRVVVVG